MKNLNLFFFVLSICSLSLISNAQTVTSCPNMNGHFQHKEILATANIIITQTACTSMEVQGSADIFGKTYNESLTSPLDGVTRSVTSPNADEKDTMSGEWNNNTVVFTADRYVTDANSKKVTHTTNLVTGELTSINVLHVTESDVDSTGKLTNTKTYDFDRVP